MLDGTMLRHIYAETLARCAPRSLLARNAEQLALTDPLDVVAIGKAAPSLVSALTELYRVERTFIAVPRGYEQPLSVPRSTIYITSHPRLSSASFEAGEALLDFVSRSSNQIVVALSGGGSAAIELELRPFFTREELMRTNDALVRSGLSIEQINTVRKHLSAVKGGRLGSLLPAGSTSIILSDVPSGRPELVASGPTLADLTTNHEAAMILRSLIDTALAEIADRLERDVPETPKEIEHIATVIGDNAMLRETAAAVAAQAGVDITVEEGEIAGDVEAAAAALFERARRTSRLVVAGGEPTVNVTGSGQGGRTFELAVRVAMLCRSRDVAMRGLFASSDGIDGNSGAAGVVFDSRKIMQLETTDFIGAALSRSDSFSLVPLLGEAIITGATGNNLRDLFLLARH